MPAIDEWDIAQGTPDPNAGGDVDWNAVEGLVGLALKAHQQKLETEKQARRFKGLTEYRSLIEGGATPEEALRRTAPDLYADSLQHLVPALRYSRPTPPVPTQLQAVPILDESGKAIGRGIPNPRGGVHLVTPPRPAAQKLSPADARELDLAKRDLSTATSGLADAQKKMLAAKAARFTKKETMAALQKDVTDYTTKLETAKQRFRSIGIDPNSVTSAPMPSAPSTGASPLPDSQDALVANTLYALPKGNFVWTGKGWKKPDTELPLMPIGDIEEPDAVER